MFKMFGQDFRRNDLRETYRRGAVDQREWRSRLGEVLPNVLQHEQLIEVRVDKGPGDGIKLPIVVVRPLRKFTIISADPSETTLKPTRCGAYEKASGKRWPSVDPREQSFQPQT
jgi:hypothetical protein